MAGPITLGSSCTDQGSFTANYWLIPQSNPCSADANVDQISIYQEGNPTTTKAMSAAVVVNDVTTNAHVTLPDTAGAGCDVHDAPGDFTAFSILNGEYLGAYSDQQISYLAAGNGGWYIGEDNVPYTGVTFGTNAGWEAEITGQATAAAGGLSIPIAMYHHMHH